MLNLELVLMKRIWQLHCFVREKKRESTMRQHSENSHLLVGWAERACSMDSVGHIGEKGLIWKYSSSLFMSLLRSWHLCFMRIQIWCIIWVRLSFHPWTNISIHFILSLISVRKYPLVVYPQVAPELTVGDDHVATIEKMVKERREKKTKENAEDKWRLPIKLLLFFPVPSRFLESFQIQNSECRHRHGYMCFHFCAWSWLCKMSMTINTSLPPFSIEPTPLQPTGCERTSLLCFEISSSRGLYQSQFPH